MGNVDRPAGASSKPESAARRPPESYTPDSNLTAAIANDPTVLERLIVLDPWFRILQQSAHGRTIQQHTTIEEVAVAAGIPVESVLVAVNAGIADRCCADCATEQPSDSPEEVPAWFSDAIAAPTLQLDVRPLLAAGIEPFGAIMRSADAVPKGGVLLIEAPFNPKPLRQVLQRKSFISYGRRTAAGHWQIWCRRSGEDPNPATGSAELQRTERTWRVGDTVHIDVRGLEAPAPLIAILSLIDGGDHCGRIIVHHDREPLYLYPELDERGWLYARLRSEADEVRLELRREG